MFSRPMLQSCAPQDMQAIALQLPCNCIAVLHETYRNAGQGRLEICQFAAFGQETRCVNKLIAVHSSLPANSSQILLAEACSTLLGQAFGPRFFWACHHMDAAHSSNIYVSGVQCNLAAH